MTYQKTSVAIAVALAMVFTFATFAAAQSEAARQLYVSAATVPTNIPLVHTYADPPNNFNILAATDEELATYGFPPRPNKQTDPDHFRMWERAMQAAKIRWKGDLKPMTFPNRETIQSTNLTSPSPEAPDTATNTSSLNWSGVVVTNALKTWNPTKSFYDIYSIFSVPTGEGSFGGPGEQYQSAAWVGLDAYYPNQKMQPAPGRTALQGGVFFYTPNGDPSTTVYTAYFGWEPAYIQGAFLVSPGDVFYADVMNPLGGNNPGTVFIEDLTRLTYGTFSLSFPGGLPFIGNSAQWIVERFCCRNSGYPYPLVNHVAVFFDGGAAVTLNGKTYYPGSAATSTRVITMRDDGDTQNIEIVNQGSSGYEGQHSILFQTTGCAWAGGCTEK